MDMSDKDFIAKAAALPREMTYCFYCASGGRTSMIVPFMQMNGFGKVNDLEGGIASWLAASEDVA
jgi:rhodanese-related sulfurtransferase